MAQGRVLLFGFLVMAHALDPAVRMRERACGPVYLYRRAVYRAAGNSDGIAPLLSRIRAAALRLIRHSRRYLRGERV